METKRSVALHSAGFNVYQFLDLGSGRVLIYPWYHVSTKKILFERESVNRRRLLVVRVADCGPLKFSQDRQKS